MINKTLIEEAKKMLFGLSAYYLGIESKEDEDVVFDDIETMKLIENNINSIFNSNDELELVFDEEGLIDCEYLYNTASEIAKVIYYNAFNLPYILEIDANDLCLDTDDIANDEDELGELVDEYLCDNYDFCFNSFNITDVRWNENKEFSSVKVIIDWDVKE